MRTYYKQILILFLLGQSYAQKDIYRNVESIEKEWKGYTSYQKEEALSFCDFLFKQGYYERCLLNAFQALYKFPNDDIVSVLNYYIGRCYEEMVNYKLASVYYQKVIKKEPKDSQSYRAAFYRNVYVKLMMDDLDGVLKITDSLKTDPYFLTFRGYSYLKKKKWDEARTSFISAQSNFSHPHYDKLITPLFQTIEEVYTVPKHNSYLIFMMSSLFPGAGQFMLGNKMQGQGIFSSVGLMMLISSWSTVKSLVGSSRVVDDISLSVPMFKNYNANGGLPKKDMIPDRIYISSSTAKYIVPPILIGSSIFITSAYKSFKDTKLKNEELINLYIEKRIEKNSPDRFLDFSEPQLIYKK
tara:strand:- start:127 stop:1191 length:1065 start_codon:yes stop_codon:yes gene_type:complete